MFCQVFGKGSIRRKQKSLPSDGEKPLLWNEKQRRNEKELTTTKNILQSKPLLDE
jgi:hypothetical protein